MRRSRCALALVATTLIAATAVTSAAARRGAAQAAAAPDANALNAFTTIARVLRHPRCMNCHPSGDVPRIGDERQLHLMNVQRGPDNRGMPGLHCGACHQTRNQDLIGVPGAESWHLAPIEMGWEDLDDHALAEQLKDRQRNGGRSLEKMLEHMAEDPLVGWGWSPDAGRAPVPIPREEVVEAFRTWVEAGAPSPPPGRTTY